MELNDLKLNWQNTGGPLKSETELVSMAKLTNHPSLKKIRVKLVAESIFLLVFLVVYYDWFDGDKKPFYANIVLIAGLLLYIANDIIGFVAIARPISGLDLKLSIRNYFTRVKRLAILSLSFSFLYSISLIVFFTSVIHFTREKRFLLVGLAIILFQLMFWSFRIWRRWIGSLKQQVLDLEGDETE